MHKEGDIYIITDWKTSTLYVGKKVQKELSTFDSLYEQRIQDLENNQGVYLELPDKFGEELGDIAQSEVAASVLEGIHHNQNQRKGDKEQQKDKIRQSPGTSFVHFTSKAYCCSSQRCISSLAMFTPTRSPLSHISLVSTHICSPSEVRTVRW